MLWFKNTEHRATGAQNVHRMGVSRNSLPDIFERSGQTPFCFETRSKLIQLTLSRQLAIQQHICDILKGGTLGKLFNRVSTVSQSDAFFADCSNRGRTGGLTSKT